MCSFLESAISNETIIFLPKNNSRKYYYTFPLLSSGLCWPTIFIKLKQPLVSMYFFAKLICFSLWWLLKVGVWFCSYFSHCPWCAVSFLCVDLTLCQAPLRKPLAPYNSVIPAIWSGNRRLNRFPHHAFLVRRVARLKTNCVKRRMNLLVGQGPSSTIK